MSVAFSCGAAPNSTIRVPQDVATIRQATARARPGDTILVGECGHCRATISHVVAVLSAVGYSGTNASEVVIRDSVWDRNGQESSPYRPTSREHAARPPATPA